MPKLKRLALIYSTSPLLLIPLVYAVSSRLFPDSITCRDGGPLSKIDVSFKPTAQELAIQRHGQVFTTICIALLLLIGITLAIKVQKLNKSKRLVLGVILAMIGYLFLLFFTLIASECNT